MKIFKAIMIVGTLSFTSSIWAAKIPKFTGYAKNSPHQMISKTKVKSNKQKIEKHNGYKVIDRHGNVSYVDNIAKPKKQVHLVSINGEPPTAKQLKNMENHIRIKKLDF